MSTARYAIVTAGKNEAAYLPGLIKAMAAQTVAPVKWVVVDDNSTDATYALAQAAAREHSFMEVRQAGGGGGRSFSSQVFAQQEGYRALRDLDVEFVGFLDADIELPPDYYEKIIGFFRADASLAIAGGLVVDKFGESLSRQRATSADHHVPGGVQLFRKDCYDQIGGYAPIEGGGQDTVVEIQCLMRGWKVQTFLNIEAIHLRPTDGDPRTRYRSGVRWGQMCYNLGYSPFYYHANTLSRFLVYRSIKLAAGQTYSFLRASFAGRPRPVSPEFVRYLRRLQMKKLKEKLLRKK
jgi:glycosyltransferase involved in cell wall biosynthesis